MRELVRTAGIVRKNDCKLLVARRRDREAMPGRDTIDRVVEKFVLELELQLSDRDVTFDVTPEATRWLGEKGYDDAFGARPLARVIQENLKKPLADEILFGKLKNGGTVRVLLDRDTDKLAFEFITNDDKRPKALPPPKKKKQEESV